jgi:transporter family-2 protein
MENLSAAWLYPIILTAGVLQAWGPPMNNALKKALVDPWLGSLVSFLPIVAFLGVVWMCQPRPLPTGGSLSQMPWWAPLGGLVGAFAVVAGLLLHCDGLAPSTPCRSPGAQALDLLVAGA